MRGLTLQDFGCLCDGLESDRENVQSVEFALENIKRYLIAGFGLKIKKQSTPDISDFEETGLGTVTWTTEEKEAWLEDPSMPNVTEFLKKYRADHGN